MQIKKLFKRKPLLVVDHTYYFLKQQETKQSGSTPDGFDALKSSAKALLGPAYMWCVYLFSPVMPRIHWQTNQLYLSYLLTKYQRPSPALNLHVGSGVDTRSANSIHLDISPYSGVDVVADALDLPFKAAQFSSYTSIAVLEHVADPEQQIKEAARVLKKGGIIVTGAPFLQAFHASPHDYTRWTHAGLRTLHERHGFTTITVEPVAGPASAFTWVLIDFLAVLLSFGSQKLHFFWLIFWSIVCFPIKLLDVFLVLYPESYRSSSFFVYVGSKK